MHFPDKISVKPVPGLSLKSFSVLLFVSQLLIQKSFAQVSEDFSDGDFTVNPTWSGTDSTFYVNDVLQLQLNSTAAGTSWLSTDFSFAGPGNIEWEFYVKQSFAPSGANFGRFYLMSDERDLTAPLNGYYLQFGEAGSNDAVELFRQSGTTSVSVCRGTAALIASSFAVRVKVNRYPDGFWQLYVDYSGGSNFVPDASGTDLIHTTSFYTGIRYTYTITNATRFYFDDIYIRSTAAPDVTPPRIVSLQPTSSYSLQVVFSEELEKASAENPDHYYVSPTIGHPLTAALQEDQKTVELLFSEHFLNGYEATVTVENVADPAGNTIPPTGVKFLYFKPEAVTFRDVIITEIFPDPSPQVGLPLAEFVELYNRSANPIQLEGWLFSDGASAGTFPPFILLPAHYVVICSSGDLPEFASYDPVISLSNFPTLNNAGDRLQVMDPEEKIIDSVHYAVEWYKDEDKALGGWTLERMDPENACDEEANWIASEDPSGGSPGKQNSVFANRPDNRGPKIISAAPLNTTVLLIRFDEKLDRTLPPAHEFTIDPPLRINALQFADASLTSLQLSLGESIVSGKPYTLKAGAVYDCPGNKIQDEFSQAVFILPEEAMPGDLLVNEILFNPRATGIDFVEIYNCSEKIIDLKNWSLRNFESAGSKPSTLITSETLLIHPNEYRVFTEDTDVLKGEYVLGVVGAFSETDLPPFNDDEGSVAIVDEGGVVIDSMRYTDKMHSVFIRDDEGVSLERISFALQGDEGSNWRSASSSSGFATPGYVNSNVRNDGLIEDGSVVVEPEIIRPSVHSQDFARIKYRFDRGGFMASVKILDQQGRIIREIAENELLGTDGFFRWDGDLENGALVRTGYYMVWFQIFDDNGMLKSYKKRVVVY